MVKPLISVIICCHNVSDYLPDCMCSLEAQTIGIEHLQLIFVDDASEDNGKTWDAILQFENKYPEQVLAIHLEENLRQGGARNVGLKYAQADYIGYVDGDDWLEETMYEKLYHYMLQYNCDIVDCRTVLDYPDGREYVGHKVESKLIRMDRSVMEGGETWISVFSEKGYGGGIVTGLYRKSLLIDSGVCFPEKILYEDNYWQDILHLYVKQYYRLGEDLYHYRQREESTVHKRNAVHHLDRMQIEEMKLSAYKRLGVYERFTNEIETSFLRAYYCHTLLTLFSKFDKPPYKAFCEMKDKVKRLIPNYKENALMHAGDMSQVLLELIDKELDEEQFWKIGKIILSCYGR